METKFNFFHHWYPLSPLVDLDPKQPTKVILLGLHLVICKPLKSSQYRVFLDQCPHRLAPLSEGRIDEKTGNLMCSYHGWEFDQGGICTRIPQAEDQTILEKNKINYCLKTFPTQEANDLLWVWPDPETTELAIKTPLPLSPQLDASQGFIWSSLVRDLEYDWQTLVENVADPSHVPFAHHKLQGNRNQASSLDLKIVESNLNKIEAKIERNLNTKITFQPPCHLEYAISFGKEKQVGLIVYCLPTLPGKSRIIAQFTRNFAQNLQKITPRWWEHLKLRNAVLDSDMIILHQQEYFLRQKEVTETWKNAYKMPTSADRLVIEFRLWFDQYCQGKLPWQNVNLEIHYQPNFNRQDLLDRYSQHTQHCSSCRGALRNIKLWQKFLLINFVITLSLLAIMPESWRLQQGIIAVIIALLGLGIYGWLKLALEPKFYFIDYIHPEKK
jgi:phenylpropionate dioxygenase-like ring-hydroxylating dioxygenase large terminal subunit